MSATACWIYSLINLNSPLRGLNISKISLYCSACQILPIRQKICLVPEDFKVSVFNKTSEKIVLQIQPLKFNPKCDILMPQIQINIKYERKFDNNGFKPKTFTMLDNSRIQNIAIDNLTAFKEYDLEISASSILGDLIMEPVKFEIKTLEGAPSPPNNVTGRLKNFNRKRGIVLNPKMECRTFLCIFLINIDILLPI